MLSQIVSALIVMVVGVFAAAAYFYLTNRVLDLALPDKAMSSPPRETCASGR